MLLGTGSFLASLALLPPARASNIVTLRLWADPAYTARKAAKPGKEKESYVVVEGEYFDGGYWDPSVNQKSLRTILDFLAPTLTKQGYYPARDTKSADELLVVHWGTTIGEISEYEKVDNSLPTQNGFHSVMMNSEYDNTPVTLASPDAADRQFDAVQAAVMAKQAAHLMQTSSAEGLLGYTKALIRERQKLMPTALLSTLEANLHEDRYFVILQAYDFPKMLGGGGKKLLWSVHMSIRSPGTSFTLALPRMGQVASEFYGTSNDDVVTGTFVPGRTATVDVGPLKVLSTSAPEDGKK